MLSLLRISDVFLKLAAGRYTENIKRQVEEAARKNTKPFSSWFPNGDRIYLPLEFVHPELQEEDEKIIDLLKRLKFDNIDFLSGYVTKNGKKFKIGTILNSLKRKFKQNSRHPEKTEEYFDNLIVSYRDSKAREGASKKDQLMVVISQNSHDIAKMSTERGWTSCMALDEPGRSSDKGIKAKQVFCEVADGGLIAYLITKNDKEIKNPLARVLLRRFVSFKILVDGELIDRKKERNIIIPEEKIYGANVPGFLETVKKWLEEKQGAIEIGRYYREGADWSDTFNSTDDLGRNIKDIFPKLDLNIGPDNYDNNDLYKTYIYNIEELSIEELISLLNYVNKYIDYIEYYFINKIIAFLLLKNNKNLYKLINWNAYRMDRIAESYFRYSNSTSLLVNSKPENICSLFFHPLKGTLFYESLKNEVKLNNEKEYKIKYKKVLNNYFFEHKYDLQSAIENYIKTIPTENVIKECENVVKTIGSKMNGEIAGVMLHVFYIRNMYDIKTFLFFKNYLSKYIGYYEFAIHHVAKFLINFGSRAKPIIPILKKMQLEYNENDKIYKLYQIVIDAIENDDKSKFIEFKKILNS